MDESGFYLLPGLVRTYAPTGQTPILDLPLSRDHLAAISGITTDGRLFLTVQERAVGGADAAGFLRQVLRLVRAPLLVIWDGAPIHRAAPIKDCSPRRAGGCGWKRCRATRPELNPDEGIRHYLKQVELRNVCCDDLPHLRDELGPRRPPPAPPARHHPGCFLEAGLSRLDGLTQPSGRAVGRAWRSN